MASVMSSDYVFVVERRTDRAGASVAFLLAQIGGHAAAKFAERLSALGLAPQHAGILRVIGAGSGLSQQALATTLSIQPSRLVLLVDELEEKGLVDRRDSRDDRRVYELHLTAKGRRALDSIARVAIEHDTAICAALNDAERAQIAQLLAKIAQEQQLTPGVHPGYKRLGSPDCPPKRGERG
jgi:DNA-binding MarR family transcriptional regulator